MNNLEYQQKINNLDYRQKINDWEDSVRHDISKLEEFDRGYYKDNPYCYSWEIDKIPFSEEYYDTLFTLEEDNEELTKQELEKAKKEVEMLENELKYLELYLSKSDNLEGNLKNTKIHKNFLQKAKETKRQIEKQKTKVQSSLKEKNTNLKQIPLILS